MFAEPQAEPKLGSSNVPNHSLISPHSEAGFISVPAVWILSNKFSELHKIYPVVKPLKTESGMSQSV